MAIWGRRALLAARNFVAVRNASRSIGTLSPLSNLSSDSAAIASSTRFRGVSDRLHTDLFLFSNRRGLAKGRKSKEEEDGSTVQVEPNLGPSVKSAALSQMEAGILSLTRELSKIRTGRASAGMLDHIIVEISGAKMPLNHVSVVSVLDAQTLSVTPYDPNALKSIESAIVSSPLGLNPTPDGNRLIAVIPPLTKENIQALSKVVTKHAEDVKQSIRRARQKALDSIKKVASKLPKDDVKRLEKEIEEMTKKFVKSADDVCKAKEKEISGI